MTRHDEPAEGDVAGVADWICDDYIAPLTCWTTPTGRKVPICEGCRVAFPNGAATQSLYGNAIATAEQRGREDNADHGMCYVSGSKALEAKMAAAWDEGHDAATRRNAIGLNRDHERNPYRATERAQ